MASLPDSLEVHRRRQASPAEGPPAGAVGPPAGVEGEPVGAAGSPPGPPAGAAAPPAGAARQPVGAAGPRVGDYLRAHAVRGWPIDGRGVAGTIVAVGRRRDGLRVTVILTVP